MCTFWCERFHATLNRVCERARAVCVAPRVHEIFEIEAIYFYPYSDLT